MKRYVSYLDFQFKVLTLFANPLSQSPCEKFGLHKNDVTKQKTSLRRDSLYSKYYQYSLNTCHLRIARNSTNASDSGFPLKLFVNTRSHVRAGQLNRSEDFEFFPGIPLIGRFLGSFWVLQTGWLSTISVETESHWRRVFLPMLCNNLRLLQTQTDRVAYNFIWCRYI